MSLYNKIITFWFHFSWNFWWPLALDENSCFIAQKITIVNLIMKVVQRIIFIPYVESKFKKNYYFWEPEYVRNYTVFFFFFLLKGNVRERETDGPMTKGRPGEEKHIFLVSMLTRDRSPGLSSASFPVVWTGSCIRSEAAGTATCSHRECWPCRP